jgi:hypothetical protein
MSDAEFLICLTLLGAAFLLAAMPHDTRWNPRKKDPDES